MKTIILFLACIIGPFYLFAQNAKDTYRVKNGTDISKEFSYQERYQFDTFREGTVYFRGGRMSKARFNYSLVHGEIQFINAKDTLLLTENDFVDRIEVGDDVFYYVKGHGHLRKKAEFGEVKLAEKLFLVPAGSEKKSAYDQYTETSAISSYSSYTNANGVRQVLEGSERVILKKRSVYFWIDKNRRFILATKGNLHKLFPDQKKSVNNYIQEQNISFEKEADLAKALQYASSL